MVQDVQIHFQKLKDKLWTYPGMDAGMKMLQGFPEEISFEFFFLIGLFQTYKDNQVTDVLSDFSVFLHFSHSMQLPCLRFPDNSLVCFASSPSSQ